MSGGVRGGGISFFHVVRLYVRPLRFGYLGYLISTANLPFCYKNYIFFSFLHT